jgi:hypothetical protein
VFVRETRFFRDKHLETEGVDGNAIFVGRLLCVSSKAFPTFVPADAIVVHDYNKYVGEYHYQYHLGSGTLSKAPDVIAEEKHVQGPYSIMWHLITC